MAAIVGNVIRRRTEDSFVFAQHKTQSAILESPAKRVWREMPATVLRTSVVNRHVRRCSGVCNDSKHGDRGQPGRF
jgi:hypothetical protein